jgi:hypothetical protein
MDTINLDELERLVPEAFESLRSNGTDWLNWLKLLSDQAKKSESLRNQITTAYECCSHLLDAQANLVNNCTKLFRQFAEKDLEILRLASQRWEARQRDQASSAGASPQPGEDAVKAEIEARKVLKMHIYLFWGISIASAGKVMVNDQNPVAKKLFEGLFAKVNEEAIKLLLNKIPGIDILITLAESIQEARLAPQMQAQNADEVTANLESFIRRCTEWRSGFDESNRNFFRPFGLTADP